jgi:hypothetical protein
VIAAMKRSAVARRLEAPAGFFYDEPRVLHDGRTRRRRCRVDAEDDHKKAIGGRNFYCLPPTAYRLFHPSKNLAMSL